MMETFMTDGFGRTTLSVDPTYLLTYLFLVKSTLVGINPTTTGGPVTKN
jgi:hypothetical protein